VVVTTINGKNANVAAIHKQVRDLGPIAVTLKFKITLRKDSSTGKCIKKVFSINVPNLIDRSGDLEQHSFALFNDLLEEKAYNHADGENENLPSQKPKSETDAHLRPEAVDDAKMGGNALLPGILTLSLSSQFVFIALVSKIFVWLVLVC
jgi:hypothetical protein